MAISTLHFFFHLYISRQWWIWGFSFLFLLVQRIELYSFSSYERKSWQVIACLVLLSGCEELDTTKWQKQSSSYEAHIKDLKHLFSVARKAIKSDCSFYSWRAWRVEGMRTLARKGYFICCSQGRHKPLLSLILYTSLHCLWECHFCYQIMFSKWTFEIMLLNVKPKNGSWSNDTWLLPFYLRQNQELTWGP